MRALKAPVLRECQITHAKRGWIREASILSGHVPRSPVDIIGETFRWF